MNTPRPRQVNEVQSLGRFNSTTRTAQQTLIAFFWANDVDGTYKPPGQHLDHTMTVSLQRGLTLQQNARLFGLVAFAMADAGITAWDTKYRTAIDLWRPDACEDGRSRIYLGVHYQFDADFGFSSGTAVGEFVVANTLRPL